MSKTPIVADAKGMQEGTAGAGDASPATANVDAALAAWIDCVAALHVTQNRGLEFANVHRFGKDTPALRTTARIADLSPSDLHDFCDWEACVNVNGYDHTCWQSDAGWERCRVCTGAGDCDGHYLSQDDCVAHAGDVGRTQCHVGLLEECAIQRGLRGPADTRVTRTCALSAQACSGALPGDLSAQALAAQRETDQVTLELFDQTLASDERFAPDADFSWFAQQLATCDAGMEAAAPPPDGGTADGPEEAAAGD
jgi:hypothetical protein